MTPSPLHKLSRKKERSTYAHLEIGEPEMKIKCIAPWMGGKRTMAPIIVEELGLHRSYWEPFCGGISVLFQKPRCRQECLNDLHGDLTNLAIVIASDRCGELYDRCTRSLYCESFYESCLDVVKCDDFGFATDPADVTTGQLNRAFAYLTLSWMGRNGTAGTARITYQFTLRYTNNGGDSATRWVQVADSIPAWNDRLRGVVITRRDGLAMLDKIDDAEGTAIYCDPPYLIEGGAYKHTFATSGAGIFDPYDDHEKLAMALRRFKKARIVVSYYASDRLADLYPGWTQRAVTMNKALAAQNKRGSVRAVAPEILLINGDSYATCSERVACEVKQ